MVDNESLNRRKKNLSKEMFSGSIKNALEDFKLSESTFWFCMSQ